MLVHSQGYKSVQLGQNEKENDHRRVNNKMDIVSCLQKMQLPSFHDLQKVRRNRRTLSFEGKKIQHQTQDEEYWHLYGRQLAQYFHTKPACSAPLSRHQIDGGLRARMLDWMVQVMSSYKFTHKTYFLGAELMDKYFQEETKVLIPTNLHIIGVIAMLTATKMEEMYPLKIKTVYEKIVHKKISVSDLLNMEATFSEALSFQFNLVSCFEVAVTKFMDLIMDNQCYVRERISEAEDIIAYLCKHAQYNYDLLCTYNRSVLASVLCSLAYEALLGRECQIKLGKQGEQCKESLLDSIRGFKNKFRGLSNLMKFTPQTVIRKVQTLL